MAIWLIRAGGHGEFEQKFLTESRVYVTWDNLGFDVSKIETREELEKQMAVLYSEAKPKRIQNWAIQIFPFAHAIQKGDLVVLPSKLQSAIYIGEITGDYTFSSKGPNPFYHWRNVKWISDPIPRTQFGQDLLHSFGAFLTICRISRNNAEERINAMRASGWQADPGFKGVIGKATKATKVSKKSQSEEIPPEADTEDAPTDLEESGRDQIAQLIRAKFSGHNLARLIDAILKVQGYTTYLSPAGPDGGIDILAGAGALGFGSPKICVQVKSQESPVGRPEVDQLLGAMDNTKADAALFVSWGGFKSTVYKELANRFFRIRLWGQKEILEQVFASYDKLDEDLRAELPLKRIWTVAQAEEE